MQYYKDLENKKLTGELEKYTKKERLMFDKELAKLKISFLRLLFLVKHHNQSLVLGVMFQFLYCTFRIFWANNIF